MLKQVSKSRLMELTGIKILWCENYAQKQEAQPQFKFKHYIFLNKINVTAIAAFKKRRYGNNSIEVIYTFYILTCSNYLTLKAESHTLNYTNLWKELKALLIISVINYTKPFCTRTFPSTLPIAGSGWIKSAGTEKSVWEIAKKKKNLKQEEIESNLKYFVHFS